MSQTELLQVPFDSPRAVLARGHTYESVTNTIASIPLTPIMKTRWQWWVGLGFSLTLLATFLAAVSYTVNTGVGIWGINIPVAWCFSITNFVWWIGIGHAGTLISAILLLLHQQWRTTINRIAEAMTLWAVMCAGMMPLLHLGRQWLFYWIVPYPNTMSIQPNFRSALVWDVFAVSTYFIISLLFWYSGMIPDLGTMRDKAQKRFAKIIYGVMAFGWRGSARHYRRYQMAYLILGGLATPLVVSVHTVVSFDFSITQLPGWHSTIFPPYFVAGAIFSGFAMVITLLAPIRAFYGLKDLITIRHMENCGKLLLVTGLIVGYGYLMETFMAWYSGSIYEKSMMLDRVFGQYGWVYYVVLFCNVILPQFMWVRRFRRNVMLLWWISIGINIGMWLERFMIIAQSLHRDFLPSSWGFFVPTLWDLLILIGSFGLFLTFQFLFMRFLPMVPISELREVVDQVNKKPAQV
jgi:Ni/Fe-hydrogenase subunit HybB-like protein